MLLKSEVFMDHSRTFRLTGALTFQDRDAVPSEAQMPEVSILPSCLLCAGPSPRVLLGPASYFLFPLPCHTSAPLPIPRQTERKSSSEAP